MGSKMIIQEASGLVHIRTTGGREFRFVGDATQQLRVPNEM